MRMGSVGQDAENAAAAYRLILLIRRFEEKVGQLYALGLIPDEVKLCIGREALFTGLNAARHDGDLWIVGRRCHGALLALGLAPAVIMRELANPSRGLFDSPKIRAEQSTIRPDDLYRCPKDNDERACWAVSLAISQRLNGRQNAVFVILDGDTLRPAQVARALHLATRFHLPIVFIIDHASPDPSPVDAQGEGPSRQIQNTVQTSPISFTVVEGIDPQNVRSACQSASDRARSGAGPQGLLIATHAFRGHASQPTAAVRGAGPQPAHDPVVTARERLLDASDGRTDTASAIEKDVRTTLTTIGLNMRAGA